MKKMLHGNKTMSKWNKPDFISLEFGELKFGKLKGHRGNGSFEIYSAMFAKPKLYFGKHCAMMPNGNIHVV